MSEKFCAIIWGSQSRQLPAAIWWLSFLFSAAIWTRFCVQKFNRAANCRRPHLPTSALLATSYSLSAIHPIGKGNFHLEFGLSYIAHNPTWIKSYNPFAIPTTQLFQPDVYRDTRSLCNITQISKCRGWMWTLWDSTFLYLKLSKRRRVDCLVTVRTQHRSCNCVQSVNGTATTVISWGATTLLLYLFEFYRPVCCLDLTNRPATLICHRGTQDSLLIHGRRKRLMYQPREIRVCHTRRPQGWAPGVERF